MRDQITFFLLPSCKRALFKSPAIQACLLEQCTLLGNSEAATLSCTPWAVEGLPFKPINSCMERMQTGGKRGDDREENWATESRKGEGKKTEKTLRKMGERRQSKGDGKIRWRISKLFGKENKQKKRHHENHAINPYLSRQPVQALSLSRFHNSFLSLVAVSRSSFSQPLEAIPPPQNHLYHHRETPKHTRNRTPLSGEAVATVAVTVT